MTATEIFVLFRQVPNVRLSLYDNANRWTICRAAIHLHPIHNINTMSSDANIKSTVESTGTCQLFKISWQTLLGAG